MNKNLLIGIGFFLAVVVIGIFLIPKKPASTPVSEEISSTTVPSTNVKEFTVTATDYAFSPSVITVKKGDSVKITLQNDGNFPHDLTISDLDLATKTIGPGRSDSIEFTADTVGNFSFICTVRGHKDNGMLGTLIVE